MSAPTITTGHALNVNVYLSEPLRLDCGWRSGGEIAATEVRVAWRKGYVRVSVNGTAYKQDGSVGKARRSGFLDLSALPADLVAQIEAARDSEVAAIAAGDL